MTSHELWNTYLTYPKTFIYHDTESNIEGKLTDPIDMDNLIHSNAEKPVLEFHTDLETSLLWVKFQEV